MLTEYQLQQRYEKKALVTVILSIPVRSVNIISLIHSSSSDQAESLSTEILRGLLTDQTHDGRLPCTVGKF